MLVSEALDSLYSDFIYDCKANTTFILGLSEGFSLAASINTLGFAHGLELLPFRNGLVCYTGMLILET
jgi:hypothetical protein